MIVPPDAATPCSVPTYDGMLLTERHPWAASVPTYSYSMFPAAITALVPFSP